MAEQVITTEARTLEEARAQLSAMIPQGSFVVSERVLCDGRPLHHESQDVTIEAATLDEARQQVRAKTPAGREVTREYELYRGKQGTLRATAYDDKDALRCARDQAPPDAEIVAERIAVHAINKKVTVSAFSQGEAQRLALKQSEGTPEARWPTVLSEPRKGFLGLGRKPGTYSVDLSFQQAAAEVDYVVKTKIRFTLSRVERPKAAVSATVVNTVEEFVATLAACTKSDPGAGSLATLLRSLETVEDARIAPILVDIVAHHLRDAASNQPVRELLEAVLTALERKGISQIRGTLIHLIFDNVEAFTRLRVPALFGPYTAVLRGLVTAFTPVVGSSRVGWRDNDGYETWFSYDTRPLEAGVAALCQIETPVSSNLLRKIGSLPPIPVPCGVSDMGDPGKSDPTAEREIRSRAKLEIGLRGNPVYDFDAYGVDEWFR